MKEQERTERDRGDWEEQERTGTRMDGERQHKWTGINRGTYMDMDIGTEKDKGHEGTGKGQEQDVQKMTGHG